MREPIREPTPQEARAAAEPLQYVRRSPVGTSAAYEPRGFVEWSPTWGGMFVSLGILVLLSTLGVAFGVTSSGTWSVIWGALSLIIAFFAGGFFAGRTIGWLDSMVAGAHGALVWAVTLIFTALFSVVLAFAGLNFVANALRVSGIENLLNSVLSGAATTTAASTTANASTSGWVGFFILLLTLIAAIVGAHVGNSGRHVEPMAR